MLRPVPRGDPVRFLYLQERESSLCEGPNRSHGDHSILPHTHLHSPMIRTVLQRASLFALAIFLIAPLASAQSQSDEATDSIAPEELEVVAKTLAQIKEVRKKYRKKIQGAKSPQKARTYRRKMVLQIDWTIEKVDDISIQRYKEITRAAESNPELKQKILAMTKKQQKDVRRRSER